MKPLSRPLGATIAPAALAAAVSFFIATSCVVVACGSSDPSPSGEPGAGGGSGGSGGEGGGGSGSNGNATSTAAERKALCSLAVPKCHPYPTEGDCLVDHTNVASCFVTSLTECVKTILSSPCDIEDYDACMKEGALACDNAAESPYFKACMDKDKSCRSKGEVDEDGYVAIEDTCNLLRALDAPGRAQGAECVAGPCDRLEECLAVITP